ncbi:serine hydrolase domain-containing protein [Streptomyces vinaceus]|uniref:serine hydrolase domain-containing protein n=1 Tax=Streptomyces vinaceus TaxID=1960 RepID=UPI0038017221
MRSAISEGMKVNRIPGAVVMIMSPKFGNWSESFGIGSLNAEQPIRMADHFRVGSNTKTMTSTIILQLAQEGKLKLEDPISKYVKRVPNGDAITIANLSEMRSGLPSYSLDREFNKTLDENPGKAWKPQDLLEIAYKYPNKFKPGEKFDYSNTNIILLGLVIEKITGESLSDAFNKRIFQPLGMTQTSLPAADDASIPDPHPQGYQFGTNVDTIDSYAVPPGQLKKALDGTLKPLNETAANPSWAWAAGGAISTTDDLTKYLKRLVGGGLLDEKMQKLRLDSIKATDPEKPEGAGYGLGIAKFGPLIGHDGQIPGYMTFMGYDPRSDLSIVIMTNLSAVPSTGEGSALTLVKKILPTFYPNYG